MTKVKARVQNKNYMQMFLNYDTVFFEKRQK